MWQSPYDIRYCSLRLLHEDSARIWDNPGPSFQASQGARTAGQHMYTIALSEKAVGRRRNIRRTGLTWALGTTVLS